MNYFRHIGQRLLFAVGLIVAIGMAAVVTLYAQRQEESIMAQNERALTKVTDSAVQGLTAIMLPGYAEIAHDYAERLKKIPDVLAFRILRIDGSEAFIDNQTIEAVNTRLGDAIFSPRKKAHAPPLVLDRRDRRLAVMMSRGDHVIFYETLDSGERTVTVLEPIVYTRRCEECHADSNGVRGLVMLTTSLKTVDADIARTWRQSILVILAALAFVFAVVWFIARRIVVEPIRRITDAMSLAARGDLTVSVPVTGHDEIGAMAGSFNKMSGDLLRLYDGLTEEQNKLTTIILGANEGIVVTDREQKVVLANPAAVKLLGKTAAEMADEGFLNLVGDPEWMNQLLTKVEADRPYGYIEYRGRTLMIHASTTRGSSGDITGSTALLRDVTEEKRLENELKRASITDALTGLFNRRHFDACLNDEFRRWQRFRGAFSLAMLDVDHFKNFNDTHGHECGDNVLQAIGALLIAIDDKSIIACRYGGEELILIMPDTAQEAAVAFAERILRQIGALSIDGLRVTVSIGVAGSPPQKCHDAEAMLKLADDALYRAKESGRNRVVGA